jgi:hypothetical protein
MTKKEFFYLLERHDWTYDFSDDGRVWKKGKDNETKLLKLAKDNQEFMKLILDYQNHIFKGSEKPMV